MKALSSTNSLISFEGWLKELEFENILGTRLAETELLKRSTIEPKLDFVVLPLTEITVPKVWKIIKDHLKKPDSGIIHVQIEKNDELLFGGYDNFHRDCVVASAGVPIEILQSLKECGVIRDYQKVNVSQHRWHD
jgi:hypothetical protein